MKKGRYQQVTSQFAMVAVMDPLPTDVLLESTPVIRSLHFDHVYCVTEVGYSTRKSESCYHHKNIEKINLQKDDENNCRSISNLTFI